MSLDLTDTQGLRLANLSAIDRAIRRSVQDAIVFISLPLAQCRDQLSLICKQVHTNSLARSHLHPI
jgi:hypothetical protein